MKASMALGLSLLMAGLALASHCVTPVKVVKVLETPIIAVPIVDYHYAIGDEYRIKRIISEVVQGQAPVSPAPAQGGALDKGIFGTVGQSINLDSQVLAIFNESCIQCHKPGASKPGVQLFTEERGLFIGGDPSKERARRVRIVESVDEGDMPKGGARLSEEKRRLLRKWAQ